MLVLVVLRRRSRARGIRPNVDFGVSFKNAPRMQNLLVPNPTYDETKVDGFADTPSPAHSSMSSEQGDHIIAPRIDLGGPNDEEDSLNGFSGEA